jgi:hypothetical protein
MMEMHSRVVCELGLAGPFRRVISGSKDLPSKPGPKEYAPEVIRLNGLFHVNCAVLQTIPRGSFACVEWYRTSAKKCALLTRQRVGLRHRNRQNRVKHVRSAWSTIRTPWKQKGLGKLNPGKLR